MVNITTRVKMDPSGVQANTDATEKHQLKVDVADGIAEMQNSDGDSSVEIHECDNDLDEEKKSCPTEDDENSVHIIFLKGDSENAPSAGNENASIEIEGASANCEVGVKPSLHPSPIEKVRVSGDPCRTVSRPSKIFDSGNEESAVSLQKLPLGEVEDDFDASDEVIFQHDQKTPSVTNPPKKKKKILFKVCKACGELVERQDFIVHIKEHRRRKLDLVPNPTIRNNDTAIGKGSSHSAKEEKSVKTYVPLVDSGIGSADNIPQCSISNSLADRPFKCSVCTETFRTQSSLTIHFKSHSGDCSNSCPVS